MLVAMVPFFTIAQEKKEIEFNGDKIADECDIVNYMVYVFTELEQLYAKNSDESDAYEMNFTSRRTAKYLIRGYHDATLFVEENDMSPRYFNECKNFNVMIELMGDDEMRRFYKDMTQNIQKEYGDHETKIPCF